jgi:hypothetical protein
LLGYGRFNVTVQLQSETRILGSIFFDTKLANVKNATLNGAVVQAASTIDVAKDYLLSVDIEDVDSGVDRAFVRFTMVEALGSTILGTSPLTNVNGKYVLTIGISNALLRSSGKWQAGKQPPRFLLEVFAYDAVGNGHGSTDGLYQQDVMLFSFLISAKDVSAPVVNLTGMDGLTKKPIKPNVEVVIFLKTVVLPGDTGVRKLVLFYGAASALQAPRASEKPATVDAWKSNKNAKSVVFSKISEDSWMAVFPGQKSGEKLIWAVYVEDYSGNGQLYDGGDKAIQVEVDSTEGVQLVGGYIFIGLLAFGIIFSISYRVQQGVVSVKKTKKVSAGVKKAAPKKTIGEPGKKTPISKDIETKVCPICKAKIGADSTECPYCHKKF